MWRAFAVGVVGVMGVVGCAHQVVVESNVPEAQVRVDGERLGAVKDGVVFEEHGGLGVTYDVEVTADGYKTERRNVKPNIIDAWVGIPAVSLAACSCCAAGCGAPVFGLVALTSESNDIASQVVGWSIAGGLVGAALGTGAVAAWGVERLPDVVSIDLTPLNEDPPVPPAPTPVVAPPPGGAMAN
jgi:hypothetical protein